MDCMHWKLKNCPSSWKGMFQGKSGRRARSDRRSQLLLLAFLLRITGLPEWYQCAWSFPVVFNAVNGEAPQVDYVVNGKRYRYACSLANGIYSLYMFHQDVPATKNTHAENVCKRPRG
jgi:hypothetical protein